METKKTAIATMTWARNAEEETLLKESLERLTELDMEIYVTDGGSGKDFLTFLERLPNVHLLPPVKGLWMQTKSSLYAALKSGAQFIFYTEPDKVAFFSNNLPDILNKFKPNNRTGAVIISRNLAGFKTFPDFQQMTENTINSCCTEVLKENFDFVYGPFFINAKIIPFLLELPETIGWGWRPYAFHIAGRLGYKVSAIEGDFNCPQAQKEDTDKERLYRMRQMVQNIEGLLLSTQADLSEKS